MLVAACTSNLPEVAQIANEPEHATDEAIKIGALAPLSAPGAVIAGKAMVEAMRIAEEQINLEGGLLGRPVALVIEDSQGLPEQGVAAMEKLIGSDGVVAVGGSQHSSVALAAMATAHESGIPVVFSGTWSDDITSSRYPEIFRIAPLNSEVAQLKVSFLSQLPEDVVKIVIITENTDFGIPAASAMADGLEDNGLTTIVFSVDIGTQDFTGLAERVRAETPDVVVILNSGESGFNFAQQAADAGVGPSDVLTLCGLSALESRSFWRTVPDGRYCIFERVGPAESQYSEVAQEFSTIYKERTGKEAVEAYTLQAYDSIKIIAQAIEEAGNTDPAAIIEALEQIEYNGALGTITFPINQDNPPEVAGVADKWWHQYPDPVFTFGQYTASDQDPNVAPIVYPEQYQTGELIIPNLE